MSHMEAQITNKGWWVRVGCKGGSIVDGEVLGTAENVQKVIKAAQIAADDSQFDEIRQTAAECVISALDDFVEQRLVPKDIQDHGTDITAIHGYGVRESAPGYLDCTEWEVFTAKAEAEARYNELKRELKGKDRD